MFSESAHKPSYLRSTKTATTQASLTVQERMPSYNESVSTMVDANERGGSEAVLSLPAAHHQLLSHDRPLFVGLKGYDHTIFNIGNDTAGGGCNSDETSFHPRKKCLTEKRQRGGSWLGFASKRGDGDVMTAATPGLVRVPSSDGESESDDDSISSSPSTSHTAKPAKRGVSFASLVKVQPIPHACAYSSSQRRRMYSSSREICRNKQKNKWEFRYDGCDWRSATEEQDMMLCTVTGELVHPANL